MASTNFKIDDREVDKMLNSLAAEIKKVRGVRVGWIREKHDKLGEGENTMEQIVFNNEFGSLTQPPRPFIRPVLKKRPGFWGKMAQDLMEENLTLKRIMAILGEQIKTDIKQSILSNIPPPNSPVTVAIKKSDRTLIDTGGMLNSIHSEIITSKIKEL